MSIISDTDVKCDDKEVKRIHINEYMKQYRKNNTEYYEKEKKYVAEFLRNKYNTDPEYRKKKNEDNIRRYHMKKQQKQLLANAIPV